MKTQFLFIYKNIYVYVCTHIKPSPSPATQSLHFYPPSLLKQGGFWVQRQSPGREGKSSTNSLHLVG